MNFKVDFSHCVLGVNAFSTARFTDVCSHRAGSSVHRLSHCAEAFWFDVIPLMDFCLVAYAFGVTKKKKKNHCKDQRQRDMSLFASRSSISSDVTCKSFCEVMLVESPKPRVRFRSLHMDTHFSHHHLLRIVLFLQWARTVDSSIKNACVGLFLLILFHWSVSAFMTLSYYLITVAL